MISPCFFGALGLVAVLFYSRSPLKTNQTSNYKLFHLGQYWLSLQFAIRGYSYQYVVITPGVATITKRTVRGITYYYLEQSVRENGQVKKKSRYLGRTVPNDISLIKKEFSYELDRKKWFDLFDKIKLNYNKELSEIQKSAREEDLKEFSIRFTYDTQRIEGSTLTLNDTAQLLQKGTSPNGKPLSDIKEAEAHKRVFYEMLEQRKDISLQLMLYWHRELFEETKTDIAGQLRLRGVRITGSRFVPPSPVEIQPLLEEFFAWYKSNKGKTNPVVLAALAQLKFVIMHPFVDGNGRISRLLMNFVLNREGYPMFNIEYRDRSSYYRALERSQVKGDENIFCQWFFRNYLQEMKHYLELG